MSNVIAAICGPGRSLCLAERVEVGDVLRIERWGGDGTYVDPEAPIMLHVVWVGPGGGPCEVMVADPSPYAGMGWVPRHLMPGEAVFVVGNLRAEAAR